ncbi:ABC transporter ATP-binding protein [Nocardioides sp. LHD-245]|uniref:ABC transporter ATP-binding protein n=1 Tax=Nocardioides sp. LHD-245 TaxID=3051387 RepID=UPI0027E083ED|nr:ABC transporter ATP-binding protein [Nocardioides sp. LHD-245]
MTTAAEDVPLLAARDLRVDFRVGGERLRAVDGITLDVARRETLGLVGESGSGKSTFGRAVMGLVPLSGGLLTYDGVDPSDLGRRERRQLQARYQMVFQDSSATLNPRRTVLDSVIEPLVVHGRLSSRQRQARAVELLERVGLSEAHGRRYPHQLSGGQRQRVSIARALVLDPELLVCDESVASLDVALQAQVLNLLSALQRELGLSFVFITHDLGVAGHMSDRLAVMYLGSLVEIGPAGAVTCDPRHPYTAALLSAQPEPVVGGRSRERIVLTGELPSPTDPPSGCRFRTRCPMAQDRCAEQAPEWREVAPGHRVACHFDFDGRWDLATIGTRASVGSVPPGPPVAAS